MTPSTLTSVPSPFDDPRPSETVVLLATGSSRGVNGCYAVGADIEPRPITPAQLVAAVESVPSTPAQPLPKDTNKRVMAAFDAFKIDFQRRLGRARRPRDTRARRYVSRQLNIALREAAGTSTEVARIEVLRRIFMGDLSPQVENALSEIRELRLEGSALRIRLEALRERYRLNPPDDSDRSHIQEPQVVRIVCSDGLTG